MLGNERGEVGAVFAIVAVITFVVLMLHMPINNSKKDKEVKSNVVVEETLDEADKEENEIDN